MSNTRAVISLGTNTSRLLVVRDLPGGEVEQLEHLAVGTRLGEGLVDKGYLGDNAMERTLAAVAQFTAAARSHGAALCTIATSAVRRAENAAVFGERMRAITGVQLRVIGGEEEAAASYAGATHGHPGGTAQVAVLDIGGGSTECAAGSGGRLERAVSCEVGSVRLSERFRGLMGAAPNEARAAAEQARAAAAEALAPLAPFAPVDELLAVAGTATTIAAVASGCDVLHVRGMVLSTETVEAVLDRLLALGLEQRRALPGMLPQRADILPAGAILLLEAMRRLGVSQVTVETNDLLLGYLLGAGRNAEGEPFRLEADRIAEIVRDLAARIRADYPAGVNLLAVLRGGMVLAVDLVRALYPLDVRLDVYPGTTMDLRGKPVVIVDDIIDSGETMRDLVAWAREHGATDVTLCTLLRRHSTPEPPVRSYSGVTIDSDEFVQGYGMDDGSGVAGRELPFVCGTGRRSERAP